MTKELIINKSAKLFAIKSYDAVSVNEIAKEVKIKPPSLYNHFKSKKDILTAILLIFKEKYILYFKNLKEAIEKENELIPIMDLLFASLRVIDNEFMYYGMAIIMKEQFHNILAKELAADLFYFDSIENLKSYFDYMIEKDIIRTCDSKAIATFFMFSVLVGSEIRLQRAKDSNFHVDIDEIYQNLYNFIINIVKK